MFRKGVHVDEHKVRSDASRPLRHMLVTGGCGFIGSNFINHFVRSHADVHVYNLDKLDYCANAHAIEVASDAHYHFVKGDIANRDLVMHLLRSYDIDTIVHFAAQTHVDNSFGNSLSFTLNNVYGTHVLLECARVYGKIGKFIHVSTDEVYGEVVDAQHEDSVLNPTNPYAATKAAAEYIAKSYHISFNLPVVITRSNNVYGPYQYPEKLIPRFLYLAYHKQPLTIHGEGNNTRSFVHCDDVARAFALLVDRGVIGEVYNVGSRDEHSVRDIAMRALRAFYDDAAVASEAAFARHVRYVRDRDFNDTRYDIDTTKLEQLGWRQCVGFDSGFAATVQWYRHAFSRNFWPSLSPHADATSSNGDTHDDMHEVAKSHTGDESTLEAIATSSCTTTPAQ